MGSFFHEGLLNLVIRGARALYPSGVVRISETLRSPRGVLLMPSESLGDMLGAFPVIRALRRAFRETRIAVMATPTASDLLRDTPGLDEVILCYPLNHPSNWRAFHRTVSELRSRGFDTLFSLDHERDRVKSLVGYLSGAKVRVGFRSRASAGLFNIVVDPPARTNYLALRNLALVGAVGIDTNGIDTAWSPSGKELRIAEQLAELRGLRSGGLIAGFEASAEQGRGRPALAERSGVLKDQFGARFVVFREHPPAAYSQEMDLTTADGAVDLACRTIRDVLAILACCDVFLCENTNLLHFAVAMGVPTVAFLPEGMSAVLVPPESRRVSIVRGNGIGNEDLLNIIARLAPPGVERRGSGKAGDSQP